MADQPGMRVWAVRNADQDTVWAYGFGTYVGDFPRPGGCGLSRAEVEAAIRAADEKDFPSVEYVAAEQAKPLSQRVNELLYDMSLNPKIILDGGGVVWGAECWWGEATDSTPQEWAKGRKVVTVSAAEETTDAAKD